MEVRMGWRGPYIRSLYNDEWNPHTYISMEVYSIVYTSATMYSNMIVNSNIATIVWCTQKTREKILIKSGTKIQGYGGWRICYPIHNHRIQCSFPCLIRTSAISHCKSKSKHAQLSYNIRSSMKLHFQLCHLRNKLAKKGCPMQTLWRCWIRKKV